MGAPRVPRERLPWVLLVVAAVVAGIVLRVVLLASNLGTLDSDEAVVGLMARKAFDGDVGAFYWGQGYGGTQEVWLTAPLLALHGTSLWLLRLVPILLTGAAVVAVWRLGLRTVGEPAATAAAAVMLVWPPFALLRLSHAYAFYASGVLYAAILLLLFVRVAETGRRRDVALLGLVAGLALWQTLQVMPIAVAGTVWTLARRPALARTAWLALPGLAVGLSPWLVSNVRHDWWSFSISSGSTPYPLRLRGFFSATFPMTLGLRVPFSSEWSLPLPVVLVVFGVLAVAFVRLAVTKRATNVSLLVATVLVFPFVYAVSPFTWLTDQPRYVLTLAPAICLLLAAAVRRLAAAVVIVAGTAAVSVAILVAMSSWQAHERPLSDARVPDDFAPIVHALDRHHLEAVFAPYWIAYRLDFETGERIVAAEADVGNLGVRNGRVLPPAPHAATESRFPAFFTDVSRRRYGYLLLRGLDTTRRARRVLERHGYEPVRLNGVILEVPS